MIPLTYEENSSYKKQKVCYIWKEFSTDDDDDDDKKKYHKVRYHSYYTGQFRGADHDICNIKYKTIKEIPIAFHNGPTNGYKFSIKELEKELEGQFECLGENPEKYITFSVTIKKELDNGKSIKHKIKFIDSFRCTQMTLPKLVNNLSEIYSNGCRRCTKKNNKTNQYVILQGLKIINHIINATAAK